MTRHQPTPNDEQRGRLAAIRAAYRRAMIREARASAALDRGGAVHTCYEGHCTTVPEDEDHGQVLADHQAAVASGDAFGAQVDPHDEPCEP